ncbi:hypothetical protein LOK49_LG12G00911 [Camellia lanceoleosa]|uniref:Uncharacterized protein n=1 Tax=Camellia lanceoleosa TaxID=1840588 RepID=A0ACC0FRZ6_9ERIC|nr:hypothetical protein LOK49_LG12G00911 [Camellia lanceoleosa]
MLRKGVQKYPKGTSRRWEVITEYIGTGRSVEEILKATKTVLLQKPDNAKAFDSFLGKRKPAQSIASPLAIREETKGVSTSNWLDGNDAKTANAKESSSQGSTPKKLDDVIGDDGACLSSDPDVWSAVQERALVPALKTFPKETSQRWERVRVAIPGKNVNQCEKKFALLKENFRNKKNVVLFIVFDSDNAAKVKMQFEKIVWLFKFSTFEILIATASLYSGEQFPTVV